MMEDFSTKKNKIKNALTALIACSKPKDDDVSAEEASLNEAVKVPFELYEAPNNTVKWCHVLKKLRKIIPRKFAFQARPRHALLAKDLVTWQAMVGRHILEYIVGRVTQYVDEHYPVDKWHLGDLIAWVAQSALKYRPRICELSKCLEGPLKMIVCPKKLLPTLSHLVKLLYAARQ
ncbi:hypothetical protein TNCV_4546461 [Trichonephila clavipes]|nr:hypothetical protein TNCV_4546461 [Trichonephila clavipes]